MNEFMAEVSLKWLQSEEDAISDQKMGELKRSMEAYEMFKSWNMEWVQYLKENATLPITVATIRNRIKWGKIVDEFKIPMDDAIKIGLVRGILLYDLGLMSDDYWVNAAMIMSASDFKEEISKFKGEKEFNTCPTCGKRMK